MPLGHEQAHNLQHSHLSSSPSDLIKPLTLSTRLRPPYQLPGHSSLGPMHVQRNYLPGPAASVVLTDSMSNSNSSSRMELTGLSGTLAPTHGPGNSYSTFAFGGVYGGEGGGDPSPVINTSGSASRPSECNEATLPAIVNTWSRVPGQGGRKVPPPYPAYPEACGKPLSPRPNLALPLGSRWPFRESPQVPPGNSASSPITRRWASAHPGGPGELSHIFGLRGFENPIPSLDQFSLYPPVEPPHIRNQKGQLQASFLNDVKGLGMSHEYMNHSVSGSRRAVCDFGFAAEAPFRPC